MFTISDFPEINVIQEILGIEFFLIG